MCDDEFLQENDEPEDTFDWLTHDDPTTRYLRRYFGEDSQ